MWSEVYNFFCVVSKIWRLNKENNRSILKQAVEETGLEIHSKPDNG